MVHFSSRRRSWFVVAISGSIVLNIILSLYVGNTFESANQPSYPLLSPQIKNTNDPSKYLINVTELRSNLVKKTASMGANVGIYFDYLPTNTIIGINERKLFAMASLLKVPVAMAIMEKVENNTVSLSDSIELTDSMLDTKYGDLWKQGIETQLTVQEALTLSLSKSDNTANQALLSRISLEDVGHVFTAFDIPTTATDSTTLNVTPKNYSSILKSLYYSTYLSPNSSNHILALLTQGASLDGGKLPIPESIPVAHKIGVQDMVNTYSDCGITYYPHHPYVVCIMVNNVSQEMAANTVREITKEIYQFIDIAVKKKL